MKFKCKKYTFNALAVENESKRASESEPNILRESKMFRIELIQYRSLEIIWFRFFLYKFGRDYMFIDLGQVSRCSMNKLLHVVNSTLKYILIKIGYKNNPVLWLNNYYCITIFCCLLLQKKIERCRVKIHANALALLNVYEHELWKSERI